MSERLRNVVIVSLLMAMAGTLAFLIFTAPSDTDRVESIGERIKCPVCQGESIANSPSQMARDMMGLVDQRVAEGQTDEAIVDELLSSYTGAVLLDPPARGSTLVLWLAPIVALGVGATVIVWWGRHPGPESAEAVDQADSSRSRRLAPLLVLAGAFAAIVVVAGFFIQDRAGPNSGMAELENQDLEDVSNDTMEAVIAANADHPEVDGMRLALAERYFEEGDYSSAFNHYFAVVESPNASDPEMVTALIQLGWMTWQGNGEADTAIELFDRALSIDENADSARYLKAQVLWCGANRPEQAADVLQALLNEPDLPAESRDAIEADLDDIDSGVACA